MNTFPSSLRTTSPAEGHLLARQLAVRALDEQRRSRTTMAEHLTTQPIPSVEALTAAYFNAVAAANEGWPR